MLVLKRWVGESFFIGEIKVKVLNIERGRVHLGIHAPPEVAVHRAEVYERIRKALPGAKIEGVDA